MVNNDPDETDYQSTASDEMNASNMDSEAILELNDVFTALNHPRRRYLLYTLASGTSEETLTDLATKIAAWEQDKPVSEVSDDERTRVQISLYHSHVPKLADLDIVEFHESDDIVVQALNIEQVQTVLDNAGGSLDNQQETHARDQ